MKPISKRSQRHQVGTGCAVQVVGEVEVNDESPDLGQYAFTGSEVTVRRKRQFIAALRREATIYHAARKVKVARKTVYEWLNLDVEFAAAVADAREDLADQMETSVFKRGLNGDPILSIFWLKARRPVFRERVTVDVQAVENELTERLQRPHLSTTTNPRRLLLPDDTDAS